MTASDDSMWRLVRRAYEAGETSVDEICHRFGPTKYHLYKKLKSEGWHLRRPLKKSDPVFPVVVGSAVTNLKSVLGAEIAPSPEHIQETDQTPHIYITRLYALVAHQISLFEAGNLNVADVEIGQNNQNPNDAERVSRTLSTLVRAIEKLVELEENLAAQNAAEQEGKTRLNADQFRIDIARRIAQFKQSETDPFLEVPDGGGTGKTGS